MSRLGSGFGFGFGFGFRIKVGIGLVSELVPGLGFGLGSVESAMCRTQHE